MGEDLGRTYVDPISGRPFLIEMLDHMTLKEYFRTLGHEVGHVIDDLAGQINTNGLMAELRGLYNTLNNRWRAPGGQYADPRARRSTPITEGYTPDDAPREYMAEAIRAYLFNPNYIKSVAPRVAAAIRAYVNSHPELSQIIQFNAAGGLAVLPQVLADDARASDAGEEASH